MCVTNEEYRGSRQVRISMCRDGRAVINTNWAVIAEKAQILPGEMAIFWFQEHGHNLLVNVFAGIPVEK